MDDKCLMELRLAAYALMAVGGVLAVYCAFQDYDKEVNGN
jgi:hypothetical protein